MGEFKVLETKMVKISDIIIREDLLPFFSKKLLPITPDNINEYAKTAEFRIERKNNHPVDYFYIAGEKVGWIDKGWIRTTEAIYLDVYRIYMDEELKHLIKDKTEKEINTEISTILKDRGYVIKNEIHTKFGKIDILAEKGDHKYIIEIKRKLQLNEASKVLGQLLFYNEVIANNGLYIYSPRKPTKDILNVLLSYSINFLDLDNDLL